jgi:hypothetical protein
MKRNITPKGKKFTKVIFLFSFFVAAILISSCSKDEMVAPVSGNAADANQKNSLPVLSPGLVRPSPGNENISMLAIPNDAMIYIRYGTCYGTCPSYSVSINAAGEVTYTGYRNVGTKGIVQYRVSRETATDQAKGMLENGFLTLNASYPAPKSDAPMVVTALRYGEITKIVVDHGFQVPRELADMRKLVELKLGVYKYVNEKEPKDLPSAISTGL